MALVGLWCWWVVLLAHRTILGSVLAVWVVLGSMGGWWALMLDRNCIGGLGGSRASGVTLGGYA